MHKPLFHRFVEFLLPWYDAKREDERNAKTERIRQRSIKARVASEEVIQAYREAPWPRVRL